VFTISSWQADVQTLRFGLFNVGATIGLYEQLRNLAKAA
jgi:hypothetical protein